MSVSLVFSVILNIGIMLILTLIVAATTLVERKILSLMQRRVGPQFVGYKGRLQYIADALKLFVKGALIPEESNKFWFITLPAVVAAICYSFWMNALWGPSICIFEIEYNIVYCSIFSALFTLCVVLTGYFSKNKYAMLAAIRAGIGMLNLELFLGLMFLNLTLVTESFSFMSAVDYQQYFWLFILFFGLGGLIAITFLLEVNRAPFDLSEAESELVAGYTVEYGGFFFGVYYLCEYLHLFFFSVVISTLFFGGWELPNFLFWQINKKEYNYFNCANFYLQITFFLEKLLEYEDILLYQYFYFLPSFFSSGIYAKSIEHAIQGYDWYMGFRSSAIIDFVLSFEFFTSPSITYFLSNCISEFSLSRYFC